MVKLVHPSLLHRMNAWREIVIDFNLFVISLWDPSTTKERLQFLSVKLDVIVK